MWQDVVFTVGTVLFSVALLFSVRSEHKPAVGTSLMNVFIIASFIIAYWSMELYYAALTNLLTFTLWAILFFQKWSKYG